MIFRLLNSHGTVDALNLTVMGRRMVEGERCSSTVKQATVVQQITVIFCCQLLAYVW